MRHTQQQSMSIDRRDPNYEPPKYNDEQLRDKYYEDLEERKEDSVEAREIRSTEEIW